MSKGLAFLHHRIFAKSRTCPKLGFRLSENPEKPKFSHPRSLSLIESNTTRGRNPTFSVVVAPKKNLDNKNRKSRVATPRCVALDETKRTRMWKFWLFWIFAKSIPITILIQSVWRTTAKKSRVATPRCVALDETKRTRMWKFWLFWIFAKSKMPILGFLGFSLSRKCQY